MSGMMGIILAAGESRRMGSPKMLLPFRGKTMIEKVMENVISSDIDNTFLVLGALYERIREIAEKYPVTICKNADYRNGMLSSVKCGFQNLPDEFEAAMVFPGDQPLIGAEVINQLIKNFRSSGKGIVIPVYTGKRGHPILIGAKYRRLVENLDSNDGLRSLAVSYPSDVFEMETAEPGILKDFDTYDEYINELNKLT